MKRKPAAAFAEEEDPETGEAVLGTGSSASIFSSAEESRERRKTWRRSASDFLSHSESWHLGSALEIIRLSKKEETLLTVVAGEHDDHEKVWKECKDSGTKFRLFSLKDNVVNGEDKTYAVREILLAKEGGDLDHENSDLIIAQRKYAANGSVSLVAHRLMFRGRPDVNRPYIFPKLGDEIPGVGCPDLHVTFRGVRDWHTVVKGANFVGCDRNVSIDVTAEDVETRKKIIFDIERDEFVRLDAKPTLGVLISCADFKPVYDRWKRSLEDPGDVYLSPPSKKRRTADGKRNVGEMSRTVGLKLIGMGPAIENEVVKADLNINLVLKL